MTTKPTLTTEDRSLALVSTVEHLGDNVYSVACQSLDGWFYLVWPKTDTRPSLCQCEHSRRHPGERCKHIWAVRKKLEQEKKDKKMTDPINTTRNRLLDIANNPNVSPEEVWGIMKYMSRQYIMEHGTQGFHTIRAHLIEALRNNPARELWLLEYPKLHKAIFNRPEDTTPKF